MLPQLSKYNIRDIYTDSESINHSVTNGNGHGIQVIDNDTLNYEEVLLKETWRDVEYKQLWHRIKVPADSNVCTFYLLGTYDNKKKDIRFLVEKQYLPTEKIKATRESDFLIRLFQKEEEKPLPIIQFYKIENISKNQSFLQQKPISFFMEFLSGGTIDTWIQSTYQFEFGRVSFDEPSAKHIIRQLLLALLFLHEANLFHGDIAPCNIFVENIVGKNGNVWYEYYRKLHKHIDMIVQKEKEMEAKKNNYNHYSHENDILKLCETIHKDLNLTLSPENMLRSQSNSSMNEDVQQTISSDVKLSTGIVTLPTILLTIRLGDFNAGGSINTDENVTSTVSSSSSSFYENRRNVYFAPELDENALRKGYEKKSDLPSDIFSVGLILLQLFGLVSIARLKEIRNAYLDDTLENLSNTKLIKKDAEYFTNNLKKLCGNKTLCRLPFDLPSHIPYEAKILLIHMLQPDPQNRPTAKECLEHPWLSTVQEKNKIEQFTWSNSLYKKYKILERRNVVIGNLFARFVVEERRNTNTIHNDSWRTEENKKYDLFVYPLLGPLQKRITDAIHRMTSCMLKISTMYNDVENCPSLPVTEAYHELIGNGAEDSVALVLKGSVMKREPFPFLIDVRRLKIKPILYYDIHFTRHIFCATIKSLRKINMPHGSLSVWNIYLVDNPKIIETSSKNGTSINLSLHPNEKNVLRIQFSDFGAQYIRLCGKMISENRRVNIRQLLHDHYPRWMSPERLIGYFGNTARKQIPYYDRYLNYVETMAKTGLPQILYLPHLRYLDSIENEIHLFNEKICLHFSAEKVHKLQLIDKSLYEFVPLNSSLFIQEHMYTDKFKELFEMSFDMEKQVFLPNFSDIKSIFESSINPMQLARDILEIIMSIEGSLLKKSEKKEISSEYQKPYLTRLSVYFQIYIIRFLTEFTCFLSTKFSSNFESENHFSEPISTILRHFRMNLDYVKVCDDDSSWIKIIYLPWQNLTDVQLFWIHILLEKSPTESFGSVFRHCIKSGSIGIAAAIQPFLTYFVDIKNNSFDLTNFIIKGVAKHVCSNKEKVNVLEGSLLFNFIKSRVLSFLHCTSILKAPSNYYGNENENATIINHSERLESLLVNVLNDNKDDKEHDITTALPSHHDDLFALGILLIYLLVGNNVIDDFNSRLNILPRAIHSGAFHQNVHYWLPQDLNENARDLIIQLLAPSHLFAKKYPDDEYVLAAKDIRRPTSLENICIHPFIKDIYSSFYEETKDVSSSISNTTFNASWSF